MAEIETHTHLVMINKLLNYNFKILSMIFFSVDKSFHNSWLKELKAKLLIGK